MTNTLHPSLNFEVIEKLGSGLGYRDKWFEQLLTQSKQQPDFLEITADHFIDAPAWKINELDALAEKFTLIPHALDLSLGSADGIDIDYLEKLADLVEKLNPPYWSEHLAFTKANGRELGHLAPLPFSHEAIEAVTRNVETTREFIPIPLILENITYGLKMDGAEMDEARFLTLALESSNCGWLLDVTNLYINSRNHNFDPAEFLNRAPTEKIVQLHYVGFSTNAKGKLIDSHGTDVNPEIRSLLNQVIEKTPVKGAILERDENLPNFEKIMGEIELTRKTGQHFGKWG
jgi:uncharacterized protein